MCGIAVIISPDPDDHALLGRMTDMLIHRGPDGQGRHGDGTASLGHRRLAILDLSEAGAQPMRNESGDVFLVCNGEIYNYLELNAKLAESGHRIRSRSDSETLVHLYEDHGEDLLERINGMFAFAVWDAARRKLFAAVDRFGKKPLYYACGGGRLVMASELKALLLFPWIGRDLDLTAIDRYLTLRHVPAPLTMFAGIKKLEPGTSLVWQDGRMSLKRYYRPAPGEAMGQGDRLEAFTELFSDAVAIRLQSDVPLGVYLSGGVDSSAVAGVMHAQGRGPAISYTLSVPYRHDERERAGRIAAHLGCEFNPVTVEGADFGLFPEIVRHLDEPFGDLLCLPTYLLARRAKEKITVVLTGDGADEILSGYFHQNVMLRWKRFSGLFRAPLVGPLLSFLVRAVPCAWLDRFFDYPDSLGPREREKLAQTMAGCGEFGRFYEGVTSCFTAEDKQALYETPMAGIMTAAPMCREFEEALSAGGGFSLMAALSLMDLKFWLPYSVIYRLDKLNMAHAVETRSPFLDYRLVEMALRFPDEAKRQAGRNKAILRDLISRLYPPHLWEKGKQAFYMPLIAAHRQAFMDWAAALLTRERITSRGLFRWSEVAGLLGAFRAGGGMLVNRQLTALAMLETWFDVFLDSGRWRG